MSKKSARQPASLGELTAGQIKGSVEGLKRLGSPHPSVRHILDVIEHLQQRPYATNAIIGGEPGTGKEGLAYTLHDLMHPDGGPVVTVSTAGRDEADLADELFGAAPRVKGERPSDGAVADADGGTLVLDEVGELSPAVQAKLLRMLQDGEIQPLGAGRVEKLDVRVVASTNRDLHAEMLAGRFREDLYYRLAVLELRIPPLAQRKQDIVPLAEELCRRYAEKFGLDGLRLSPELLARLEHMPWPGNVRQLENTVARLAALSTGGAIPASALDQPTAPLVEGAGSPDDGPSLREQVEAFERNLIARALQAAGGNQSEAARRLQTSRVTLIDKLKKYGLADG